MGISYTTLESFNEWRSLKHLKFISFTSDSSREAEYPTASLLGLHMQNSAPKYEVS